MLTDMHPCEEKEKKEHMVMKIYIIWRTTKTLNRLNIMKKIREKKTCHENIYELRELQQLRAEFNYA